MVHFFTRKQTPPSKPLPTARTRPTLGCLLPIDQVKVEVVRQESYQAAAGAHRRTVSALRLCTPLAVSGTRGGGGDGRVAMVWRDSDSWAHVTDSRGWGNSRRPRGVDGGSDQGCGGVGSRVSLAGQGLITPRASPDPIPGMDRRTSSSPPASANIANMENMVRVGRAPFGCI